MTEWNALEDRIIGCYLCPRLVSWREEVARTRRRAYQDQTYWGRAVPGFGDHDARVLAVGLAPGAHGANRTGRIFTGDSSGDFLFAALHRTGFANQPSSHHLGDGLVLSNLYVSAVCRCVPPDNRPARDEIARCLPYLEQEIELLSELRVIVALGQVAFEAILRILAPELRGGQSAVRFAHGAVTCLAGGNRWVVASYHPSRQNTQTGRLTIEMFDTVWRTAGRLAAAGLP